MSREGVPLPWVSVGWHPTFGSAIALGRKGVPDPLDLWVIVPHFGHDQHVEPHAQLRELAPLLEKLMGGPDQAGLLARVDTSRRSAEPVARPGAHLGDDQDIPVAGNDVQFTQAA